MTKIFPTQYSVLSAAALNVKIQESYGLKATTCKLLIHNVSDTYVVENAESKYIFKIYRDAHRKQEEIKAEVELLKLLKEKGAGVSSPLADVAGNYLLPFQAAEGIRYGVLFSFAYGKVVYDFSTKQLTDVGIGMAKIHQITAEATLQHQRKAYTIDTLLTQPIATIKPAFQGMENDYAWLADTAKKVSDKIQQFDTAKFSNGYCHYDFFPKNFHFNDEGKITFFDFDFAGKGLLANDLASFYLHFFLEVYANRITQQKADELFQVFIAGYRSVKPLSEEEVKAIPYLGFAFWIFYFGFHFENFDDWSNIFFSPKFIKDRVMLIKKWTEWYCQFN